MLPKRTVAAMLLSLTWCAGAAAPVVRAQPGESKPPLFEGMPEDKKPRDPFGDPLPEGVLARMGSVRLRQYFASMAFAPDGKALLSVGLRDGNVRSWRVPTGELLRQISLHPETPGQHHFRYFFLSANGRTVVGEGHSKLCVWEAATRKRLREISLGDDYVIRSAVSSDGHFFAAITTSEGERTLRVWDTATGKEHHVRLKTPSLFEQLTFSPDGKLLAVCEDGAFSIWTADTSKEVLQKGHPVYNAAFSPDGKTVAVGVRDGVLLWETATGKEQAALGKRNAGKCFSQQFSPDGKTLAVGCNAGLLLWDVPARKELHTLPDRFAGQLAFSPDGKTLASCSDHLIRLWDVRTGKPLHDRPGHAGTVNGLAVAPDGKTLASTSPYDKGPLLWDSATGKLRRVLEGQPFARGVAFSTDGKLVVSGDSGPTTVRLWDAATGKGLRNFQLPVREEEGENHSVSAFRLSADGKQLAAIRSSAYLGTEISCALSIWDTATGKLLHSRPLPRESNPSFTPDGASILVWQRFRLSLQDPITGRELLWVPGKLANPLAFSPDSNVLAVGIARKDDDVISNWLPAGGGSGTAWEVGLVELATGKELLRIKTGLVKRLAFSSDGRILAAAVYDTILLWDAATGARLSKRPPPKLPLPKSDGSSVTALSFVPHRHVLATALEDGTILIRDLSSAARPKRLIEPDADTKTLKRLWDDLAGEDAARAYQSAWKLSEVPAKAVPFLKDHLRPFAAPDAKKTERWIADLGSERFAVRDSASQELAKLGLRAESALRRALEGKPSLEVRKRIEALLTEARHSARTIVPAGETLRTLRAIGVLERIGTAEAKRVLEALAGGAAGARETREARAALRRLAARAG